ncbi:MAG: CDP-alcohol phosphatidyltransferase family protein [Rhodospirillales bacterium]|nr:CDP-alcohol phosphatidyltransferase family protein [Rhodospirillales bacterium]
MTTARLATGLGAAGLYGMGGTPWHIYASGVFVLSLFLDRADGILARLKSRTSKFGHVYDLVADSLSNALVFVGIGFGLRGGNLGGWAVPLGVIAGIAVLSVLASVMRIEARKGERAAEIKNPSGFDPDDAMLFVPIAMLLGWAEGLILAASLGASLFALIFIFYHRKNLFGTAPSRDPN